VPWNPRFAERTFNRHGADILLQNEPDWITRPYVLFHHSAQAVPTEGCPAKSSSVRGVKMRTRHVFAGSFLRQERRSFRRN